MTEDEMVGWCHRLNGHEFEQAPGDSEGQGSLACCSPWSFKSQTRLSNGTTRAFVVVQTVKNLPAMQETWVRCLGGEDPREKEMAIHSVFLPVGFHGQRSLTGYRVHGVANSRIRLSK